MNRCQTLLFKHPHLQGRCIGRAPHELLDFISEVRHLLLQIIKALLEVLHCDVTSSPRVSYSAITEY